MIPTEHLTAAGKLLEADRRSPAAFRATLARIPIGALPGVVEALAQLANEHEQAVRAVRSARDDWTATEAKRAHAAYERGLRDVWTTEGERCYQRRKKRHYRAQERTT